MGGHQREGREVEELGWRSPSPRFRVRGAAASSTPEDTPSEAPPTGEGEREAEAGFESASEEREEVRGPGAGRVECFLFLLFYFLWRTRGKEIEDPYLDRALRSGAGYGYCKSPSLP